MSEQTTSLIVFMDPQPPHYRHTDVDGDRLLITTADIPEQGPGVHFRTDAPGSSVPLDKIPELLAALQEIATCPACEAPPLEWCVACGRTDDRAFRGHGAARGICEDHLLHALSPHESEAR